MPIGAFFIFYFRKLNIVITGNRGEWSEIYALFKLLGDGKLYAGDGNLNKIEELFYPILKIIRNEVDGDFLYSINGDLVVVSGSDFETRIPINVFTEYAVLLMRKIKQSSGAFCIPDVEEFMSSIKCYTLKAKSSSKTDIRIVVHDKRISHEVDLGFSIKSQFGSDATLLNAGKTTNFIYKIINYIPTSEEIAEINAINSKSKIRDRIETIMSRGGVLEFVRVEHDIFRNNLVLIDSFLPNILADIVKHFFSSHFSSIKELTDFVKENNPMCYDTTSCHPFYEYKIKRFLADVALGMVAGTLWSGIYDTTGGFLIVKDNGDVLCYHIYNRNQYEDYLFHNTKLETASSSRHDFGHLYESDNNIYIKLNLQVRFK